MGNHTFTCLLVPDEWIVIGNEWSCGTEIWKMENEIRLLCVDTEGKEGKERGGGGRTLRGKQSHDRRLQCDVQQWKW